MGKMACHTVWKQGMAFEAQVRDHRVMMDTKKESGGQDEGPSPKEILLGAISACAGIDVVSILQKMRLDLQSCEVSSETETTAGAPSIFREVFLRFLIQGPDIKEAQALKAVTLSMTKYCGVSAMVASVSPIKYEVVLNGQSLGIAMAAFDIPSDEGAPV